MNMKYEELLFKSAPKALVLVRFIMVVGFVSMILNLGCDWIIHLDKVIIIFNLGWNI